MAKRVEWGPGEKKKSCAFTPGVWGPGMSLHLHGDTHLRWWVPSVHNPLGRKKSRSAFEPSQKLVQIDLNDTIAFAQQH